MKSFSLLAAVLFHACLLNAQSARFIQLKREPVAFFPNGYYIADVIDDRDDKGNIGTINANGKREVFDMQGGITGGLKVYLHDNLKQDGSSQPVTLHIIGLNADARKKGQEWDATAKADFAFYVGDVKAAELSGNSHATMASDPGDYYEGFIRKVVADDLKKFGEWWEKNKGSIATSSSVRVNASIGRTTDKPDCIVYSAGRPLQIVDFQGPVRGQEFEMAVTASGIGVSYMEKTENGQIVLDLKVTPYFNKANSWFKKEGRNTNVLAHEQTHFDITAIKACELVNLLRKTTFTKDNYKQLLDQLQQQNSDESGREEATYDAETNHGIITDKQMEWQKRITEQVKSIGCY
jgi:hypothetical protein